MGPIPAQLKSIEATGIAIGGGKNRIRGDVGGLFRPHFCNPTNGIR
jgi:hypothetical protein